MNSKERSDYLNFNKKGRVEGNFNAPKKPVVPTPIGFYPMYNPLAQMQAMQGMQGMQGMQPMQGMPYPYPPSYGRQGGFGYNPQSNLQ